MKPVRLVQDIVRPKIAAKSGGARFTGAISKLSRAKIPFFVWFVALLAEATFMAGITVRPPEPQSSGTERGQDVAMDIPQTAVIAQNAVEVPSSTPPIADSESTSSTSTATTSFGSLPVVQVFSFKPTSTEPTSTVVASGKKISTPVDQPKPKPAPAPVTVPAVITARSLLDATTLSLVEKHDGPYKAVFTTDAGTYGKITWSLADATLTIDRSMPNFSISFSCDPLPGLPDPSVPDQNPAFNVRSPYTCAVSLTPASGNDRQAQSRQFPFTTDAGELLVTPPSSMNTVLANNINFGGFIFRNNDTQPVTITGLNIDVSYNGLNIVNTPLVLRFKNPTTEDSLADYHLEGLAADPSSPYLHAGTGIQIPLSLTLGPANQKMLPVNVLGVQRLSIYGTDPTVAITLRGVTTNQSAGKVVLNSPKISWSCIVPLGSFDPNATSGPYATGQACQ